jgi:hypothetical protein
MGSPSSTTVVVIGDEAGSALHALDALANVRAGRLRAMPDEDAARWTSGAHTPYVVHDRDPLEHVAAAWVESFDDLSTLDVLEWEIERALVALARDAVSMPDYYVVLAPESLSTTWKHWWLGVMPHASPTRVIPWSDSDASLTGLLRRLPTGRPWPKPEPWLRGLTRVVPDRAFSAQDEQSLLDGVGEMPQQGEV